MMETEQFDLLVVGGGAAGMAAAAAAAEAGNRVLLAEQAPRLGGILCQCLHRGFGKAAFGEERSGPDYAAWLLDRLRVSGAELRTGTTVTALRQDRTALLSGPGGLRRVGFSRCLLAAGCYERTAESLPLAGTRPAGVFTAGTAQALCNLGHYSIGQRIVILGSGDVGQIMARQFVQSGKQVVCMVEQRDTPGGLARNRRDCLEACRIPLRLRATVDEVLGTGRVRGVVIRDLDTGERTAVECDTLVTALGLIPDRSLCHSLQKEGQVPDWLRPVGNCDYVHDMVDSVVREAALLGAAAFGEDRVRKP